MERINWADPSLSGGLFEKIVGCLLGNEHPDSVRVRPSQGDGGVDIFVPVAEGVVDVYQAKYYPNRLAWTKIRASLASLPEGEWLGRSVRNWYLTVPKQPTPDNLRKLDELGEDVPFETHWFAEDRLVSLAARHPEVGDYYLGDGRSQLERLIQDWASCIERIGAGESPHIEDVQARLSDLAAALGRSDPHFRYGFDVHPVSHDPRIVARPGAIAASAQVVDDNLVTCHVYLKYRGAEEDAADRLGFRLDLTPEAAARLAEAIAVGGAPVELAATDILSFEFPRVGHQAPAGAEFFARIIPLVDTTAATLRLVLTAENGGRTVVRIRRTSLTPGNEGATSVWVTPGACFDITLVTWERKLRLHLSLRRTTNLDGPITAIAADINIMRALQPGTTIAVALEHGPLDPPQFMLTLDESLVAPQIVAMLDALRVIQDHTTTTVTIPDEITGKGIVDIIEKAALLEGLAITGDMRGRRTRLAVEKTDLGPDGPQNVFADDFSLAVALNPCSEIALPHQTIDLPDPLIVVRAFPTVRAATIEETDAERVMLTLEPGAIPIWIDKRIGTLDALNDDLHHELCQQQVHIDVNDLTAQLASRGTEASI